MTATDSMKLIQEIVDDIIRLSVMDKGDRQMNEHEKAIELLARALYDFTVFHQPPYPPNEEALKGTIAKVKIAFNTIERTKKTNIRMTRLNVNTLK